MIIDIDRKSNKILLSVQKLFDSSECKGKPTKSATKKLNSQLSTPLRTKQQNYLRAYQLFKLDSYLFISIPAYLNIFKNLSDFKRAVIGSMAEQYRFSLCNKTILSRSPYR